MDERTRARPRPKSSGYSLTELVGGTHAVPIASPGVAPGDWGWRLELGDLDRVGADGQPKA
jgi:hypothetical protein